jgi:LAO/AO transport system kinase
VSARVDVAIGELFERARAGERRAVGRLLSFAEAGGDRADELADLVHPHTGRAHVVGITGAPGAGKSTLTGRLVAHVTGDDPGDGSRVGARSGAPGRGVRCAVLAVDPSSPLSGGAILGDRIRMDPVVRGDGVFIRSMATRGHGGGLALAVPAAVRVLDAVGFDLIVVETVGVGQIEIDVASAADTVVVVVTPGWGDAVQANKAGLLELADVLVVNKADRPGADDARRDLELMLDLTVLGAWRPPIVLTTATEARGTAELSETLVAHRCFLEETGALLDRRRRRVRHELVTRVEVLLAERARHEIATPMGLGLLDAVAGHTMTPSAAAEALLAAVVSRAEPVAPGREC